MVLSTLDAAVMLACVGVIMAPVYAVLYLAWFRLGSVLAAASSAWLVSNIAFAGAGPIVESTLPELETGAGEGEIRERVSLFVDRLEEDGEAPGLTERARAALALGPNQPPMYALAHDLERALDGANKRRLLTELTVACAKAAESRGVLPAGFAADVLPGKLAGLEPVLNRAALALQSQLSPLGTLLLELIPGAVFHAMAADSHRAATVAATAAAGPKKTQ